MGTMNSVTNKNESAIPRTSNPLISAAIQLLNQSGGLTGLIQKFKTRGLGYVVQSWIGTEPNLPVDESQLQQVLGRDQLATVAREVGVPLSDLTQRLSGFLPKLVNEMTPKGQLPEDQPNTQSLLSMGIKVLGH